MDKPVSTTMILKCYWTDGGRRMAREYQSKDVNELIGQATLERMAHTDWVGFRITDVQGHTVYERWPGKTKWTEGSWPA